MSRGFAVLGALLLIASPTSAAFINVYGAPGYTPGVGGFRGGGVPAVNSAGTAAGWTVKYDASGNSLGHRAVRWDAAGPGTELGHLGTTATGGTNAYASDLNGAGTIVGRAEIAAGGGSGTRAVRWDASGTDAVELGNLGTRAGSANVDASAINSAGTVVGYADKYESGSYRGERAVRWDAAGAATELGSLGTQFGMTRARAVDINDAGTAVGYADTYDDAGNNDGLRAVRWDASGTAATELGHIGANSNGVTNARALAINNAGTAVGYADKFDASGNYTGVYAVRWDASGTAATELGTLGTTINHAYAINDAGTAVGFTDKAGATAVRWDGAGTAATELGNLGTSIGTPSTTIARAAGINSFGFAVGYARHFNESGRYTTDRAVYWDLDGTAVDLNSLIDPASGWLLLNASAISDTGWIVGLGRFDPDGAGGQPTYERLFLLQVPATVPEPSTLSLFALGTLGLLRRRRTP